MIYGDSSSLINDGVSIPNTLSILSSNNLYTYVMNKSTGYIDFDGKFPVPLITGAIGGFMGGVVGAGTSIVSQGIRNGWSNISLAEVGISAGAGALSGSGVGLVAGNAVIDTGSYAATQWLNY